MSGRKIRVKIEAIFDEDNINEMMREDGDEPFTDQELLDYAVDTFVDDLYDRVKFSTITEAIKTNFDSTKETI